MAEDNLQEMDKDMGSESQEFRFKAVSRLLETHGDDAMLDWPLQRWLQPDDRHLPAALLNQTVRTILQTPFAEIAGRPGIGETRLEKLFAVIDRAANAMGWDGGDSFHIADEANGDSFFNRFGFPFHVVRNAYFLGAAKTPYWELTDRDWESMARLIRHHCLEDYVLGRFARALHGLHPSLWQERICTFTQQRFSELTWQKGFGHLRQTHVVDLIENLAWLLSTLPAQNDIRVAVLPARIAEANKWIAQLQGHGQLPSVHSICEHFLEPLLAQVKHDLGERGERVSEVTKRRIGEAGQVPTFRDIGNDIGVTGNRIRQLIQQGAVVFQVRWPEGRYLLQGICAELSGRPDAADHQQLLQKIYGVFFKSAKADRFGDTH